MLTLVPLFHKYGYEVQSDSKMPGPTLGTMWCCELDSSRRHSPFQREAERVKEPWKPERWYVLPLFRTSRRENKCCPEQSHEAGSFSPLPCTLLHRLWEHVAEQKTEPLIGQPEAAWLGFLSFTTVCLPMWWDILEGHPGTQRNACSTFSYSPSGPRLRCLFRVKDGVGVQELHFVTKQLNQKESLKCSHVTHSLSFHRSSSSYFKLKSAQMYTVWTEGLQHQEFLSRYLLLFGITW